MTWAPPSGEQLLYLLSADEGQNRYTSARRRSTLTGDVAEQPVPLEIRSATRRSIDTACSRARSVRPASSTAARYSTGCTGRPMPPRHGGAPAAALRRRWPTSISTGRSMSVISSKSAPASPTPETAACTSSSRSSPASPPTPLRPKLPSAQSFSSPSMRSGIRPRCRRGLRSPCSSFNGNGRRGCGSGHAGWSTTPSRGRATQASQPLHAEPAHPGVQDRRPPRRHRARRSGHPMARRSR